MKIGDRVIVDRIYFDHLVRRDEETEEAPDERQRKSLKRFMGKVGTISSIGRTGGMEAHTQYMVFFHNQEELPFAEMELELTTKPISKDIPKEKVIKDIYEPLSTEEKDLAKTLFTNLFIGNPDPDKIFRRRKEFTEDCIGAAIDFIKESKLKWYRETREQE